ncbi:efflux RND transporter periplasmic adaptor subunit [Chloroflexota bacterium]
MKGTVAVVIADPEKFKADILVSEMDILQVKLGGEAWVQVDAMQGLSLPAKVTHISPTATIQSGVVNYMVKVEVESLQAIQRQKQEAMQETAEDIQQGEIPERLKQAIEAGQITREQAEEMIGQMQQGQSQQSMMSQGQLPLMISENFQLREGLTVTVNIILEERNDVLVVPNGAVNNRNGQSYVQVMTAAGVTEDRTVQTGISNWQYTEITDGLSEGEQVLVPQGTGIAATAGQVQSGARGVRMPFMPH